MSHNKPLAIFDLDGTLVDSRQNIANAVNFIRAKHNLLPLTPEFIGININRIDINPAKVFYEVDALEIWHFSAFTDYYLAHTHEGIDFYSGIKDSLLKLKEAGFELGVATNGTSKFAETILSALGASELFCMILGADLVEKPKPFPDMIHKIKDYTKSEKVIFVGDSIKDAQAAKSANAKFAFAAYGFGPYDVASDLRLEKSSELSKIIELI